MDENTNQSTGTPSSGNKMLIPAVVIGLLVLAAIAYFAMNMNQNTNQVATQPTPEAMQETATPTTAETTDTEGATASAYKDGDYEATGNYITPGGARNVDVTITLAEGVITDATFTGNATDPNSRRFQTEFKENFAPLVVGKNIDEVSLSKVAGSSLSPKGFMDALNKIKTEAEA